MSDTVTLSRADYERLVSAAEDAMDLRAYDKIKDDLARGVEDLIPAEFANRLIDGESPVLVYRELRGLSGAELARRAGMTRAQVSDIEKGRSSGSIASMQRLASALDVLVDDLI